MRAERCKMSRCRFTFAAAVNEHLQQNSHVHGKGCRQTALFQTPSDAVGILAKHLQLPSA